MTAYVTVVGLSIALVGCSSSSTQPPPSQSFIGTAVNWPSRYRITLADRKWSIAIGSPAMDGSIDWKPVQIPEQREDAISFKAPWGDPPGTVLLGWHLDLDLRDISRPTFIGLLTGDLFDSDYVELRFILSHREPSGPANGSQPVRSETNRTSAA